MRTATTRKHFLAKMIGLIAASGFVVKSMASKTNQSASKLPSAVTTSVPFELRQDARAIARRTGSV